MPKTALLLLVTVRQRVLGYYFAIGQLIETLALHHKIVGQAIFTVDLFCPLYGLAKQVRKQRGVLIGGQAVQFFYSHFSRSLISMF
jgi:hypothetical protein